MRNDPFGPFTSPEELARGRRTMLANLAIALAALVLAVVVSRNYDDGRLLAVYLLAGGLHFVAALAAAVRWSRTPEFATELERVD
jgi:hypoxanthine-guanine phosphoribosyltransferase